MKLNLSATFTKLIFLFSVLLLVAPSAKATKYAGAFMADGGGARAMALGSAYVAIADDASAAFWNPAGLLNLSGRQVLAMHSERFGDLVDRDYLSYAQPLNAHGEGWSSGAFAFSLIHLGVDDIAFTDHINLDSNGDGSIDDVEILQILDPDFQSQIEFKSDRELAFMASYARFFGKWQAGASLKFIRQAVGDFSSFGVGIDLGAMRKNVWKELDLGIKLQDATSTYLSWNTGTNETIAPVLTPGVAYDFHFQKLLVDVQLTGALEFHFDNRGGIDQFSYHAWGGFFEELSSNGFFGIETSLRKKAHLRFGSHGGLDIEDLTFGIGLDLRNLTVDYAHAGDVLNIDENTHRISLSYHF